MQNDLTTMKFAPRWHSCFAVKNSIVIAIVWENYNGLLAKFENQLTSQSEDAEYHVYFIHNAA